MGLPCWEKPFPLSHCHQPSPQLSIAGTALQVHALHPGSSGLRVGVIALLKSRNLFLIFIFYLGKKKKKQNNNNKRAPGAFATVWIAELAAPKLAAGPCSSTDGFL